MILREQIRLKILSKLGREKRTLTMVVLGVHLDNMHIAFNELDKLVDERCVNKCGLQGPLHFGYSLTDAGRREFDRLVKIEPGAVR